MIENAFRRIALAQGLLSSVPPSAVGTDTGQVPDRAGEPAGPADNPAMAEQRVPHA